MKEARSTMQQKALSILSDIRFYIVLSIALKLDGITIPPSYVHAWRESLGFMMSRHFATDEWNIIRGWIDHGGRDPKILAGELPLLNYTHGMLDRIIGYEDWHGKLLMILWSSVGIWWFYKWVLNQSNKQWAFIASIAFMFSSYFYYSRMEMPDAFAITWMLGAVYFGTNYLQGSGRQSLVAAIIFAIIGGLTKMPSVIVLVLLLWPMLEEGLFKPRTRWLMVLFISVGIATYLWYFERVPYVLEKLDGFALFFPNSIAEGWEYIKAHHQQLHNMWIEGQGSIFWFYASIIGLVITIVQKRTSLLLMALATLGITFLFMLKSAPTWLTHDYYILPTLPMLSVLIAIGVDNVFKDNWLRYGILLFVCINVYNTQHSRFFGTSYTAYLRELHEKRDQFVTDKDYYFTLEELNPSAPYALRRPSQTATPDFFIGHPEKLIAIKNVGYNRIFMRKDVGYYDLPLRKVFEGDYFVIWDLDSLEE